MSTSVGMKVRKKQSLSQQAAPANARYSAMEHSLVKLENVCMRILDSSFAEQGGDTERLYWQQRFKNIVTPVSLALAEYKGPQRFHYHYRHNGDDSLHPVPGPDPLDLVAQVCADALLSCQSKLVGLRDADLMDNERMIEQALIHFLVRYQKLR